MTVVGATYAIDAVTPDTVATIPVGAADVITAFDAALGALDPPE